MTEQKYCCFKKPLRTLESCESNQNHNLDLIRTQSYHAKFDFSFFDTLSNAICLLHKQSNSDEDKQLNPPPGFEQYAKNKYFQKRWCRDKIISMIDPVLRTRINTLMNTETSQFSSDLNNDIVHSPMSFRDPMTIKIVVDLAQKLNLHITFYRLNYVKKTTKEKDSYESADSESCVYDSEIQIGKQTLCVKPRLTFNKMGNIMEPQLIPKKISIAYHGDLYRDDVMFDHPINRDAAYSLILSKTPHSEELCRSDEHLKLTNIYSSPLADNAVNFRIHDYSADKMIHEDLQRVSKSVYDNVYYDSVYHDSVCDEKFTDTTTVPVVISTTPKNHCLFTPVIELNTAHVQNASDAVFVESSPRTKHHIIKDVLKEMQCSVKNAIDDVSTNINGLVKRGEYLGLLLSSFQCVLDAKSISFMNLHKIMHNIECTVVENGSLDQENEKELYAETRNTLSLIQSTFTELDKKYRCIKAMIDANDTNIRKKRLNRDLQIDNLNRIDKYIADLEASHNLVKFQDLTQKKAHFREGTTAHKKNHDDHKNISPDTKTATKINESVEKTDDRFIGLEKKGKCNNYDIKPARRHRIKRNHNESFFKKK